ncbi:hypothetical protein GGI13_003433, partial [Coemansia sp. RSA 455]
MLDEEHRKAVYGGEPPVKLQSDKMINIKKKMIKIPTPLSFDEELPEEEFVSIIHKLCDRVNRLEMDKVATNNRISTLKDYVYKLPGSSKGLQQAYERELLIEAQEKAPDNMRIMSEEEHAIWDNPTFEEVASKETVEARDK